MKLTDEIMALVASRPEGPTIALCMAARGADRAAVREAMEALDQAGRAVLAKRGKVLHLLPLGHGEAVCENCRAIFKRTDKQRTCSRSCAVSLSWRKPGVREAKIAGIKRERATPKAKARAAKFNAERWSRPGERKRLSEWNKGQWRDPVVRAEMSAKIKIAQSKPEQRALYSEIRKEYWRDPVKRARMVEGIKRSKSTPEAKALFSELLRKRWQDPVLRPKYLAAARRGAAKAAARKHGTKEAPEITAKRIGAVKRSKSNREVNA